MPSIEENKAAWDGYGWEQGGDEWSEAAGGADMQWYGTILPRIHRYMPAQTILEIAPGFGRWTQFLKDLCNDLIIVDLSEKCIQACKRRFISCSHIQYYVNDGKSLGFLPDGSVDFVFSYDSLVHAEADVVEAYVHELGRKLSRDGVGFIHHSNLGEYTAAGANITEPTHWRAPSMTADSFTRYATRSGLECISQEIINWGSGPYLIDCITVFTKKGSLWARANRVTRNGDFSRETRYLFMLSAMYGVNPGES